MKEAIMDGANAISLPKYMQKKGDCFYFTKWDPDTRKVRWTRLGKDLDKAMAAHSAKANEPAYKSYSLETAQLFPMTDEEIKKRKRSLLYGARINARVKGRECSLTREDIDALFLRAVGKCEVTGIPFSVRKIGDYRRQPFSPSLDRIDVNVGYTLENCRLVCTAVNLAMNEWGLDFLKILATAYIECSGDFRR